MINKTDKTNTNSKIIKRCLLILIFIGLIVLIYEMCKIEKHTHLSASELKWLDCYHADDTIIKFQNQYGKIDSMIVDKISIHNSNFPLMNPFIKFEIGADYRASYTIYFSIYHADFIYYGFLSIVKTDNNTAPLAEWKIGNLYQKNNLVRLDNKDYVLGDTLNSKYIERDAPTDSTLCVRSIEWCKGIGLKSYTLRNGETFTLMSK